MSDEKCACPDCSCSASGPHAVRRDEKAFCSKACAEGHPDGAGCCGGDCNCKG